MMNIKNSTRHRWIMLAAFFIIQCTWFISTAEAQIKNVHGTLSDDMGELVGATVCEIDNSGRIIEATVTDLNGRVLSASKIATSTQEVRLAKTGPMLVIVGNKAYKVVK